MLYLFVMDNLLLLIKSYLQCFLTLARQGDRENSTLTLLQTDHAEKEKPSTPPGINPHDNLDNVVDDILKNVPQRSVKKRSLHFR